LDQISLPKKDVAEQDQAETADNDVCVNLTFFGNNTYEASGSNDMNKIMVESDQSKQVLRINMPDDQEKDVKPVLVPIPNLAPPTVSFNEDLVSDFEDIEEALLDALLS
jgi:hypothetical protein